jgi:hypothetical protein
MTITTSIGFGFSPAAVPFFSHGGLCDHQILEAQQLGRATVRLTEMHHQLSKLSFRLQWLVLAAPA